MTKKFHRLRRLLGASLLALLIGVPFLRVHGESAVRFDVPTLRLLFFGTEIWMADFFIVLIAVVFLTLFTLFATTIFGRVWCGWLCPQTVLVDFSMFLESAPNRGLMARTGATAAGVIVSAVIAASLVGYFVSPYELPAMFRAGGAPLKIAVGSWSALTVILFLDLVALRRRFCATACPYAKMQNVLFDDRTLTVAFDDRRAEECMQCAACLKACPVGIDIRKGPQMACIHCAECVDACSERMAARDRKSLVRYAFGAPGEKTGIRINPLIIGVITAISLVFLMYLSATRMPFDMNVRLNFTGMPEMSADGSVTNSYELSFRNMSKSDLKLDLIADASAGIVKVSPDAILLLRGTGITRVPVSVTLKGLSSQTQRRVTVTLTARTQQYEKSLAKKVYFMMPEHS